MSPYRHWTLSERSNVLIHEIRGWTVQPVIEGMIYLLRSTDNLTIVRRQIALTGGRTSNRRDRRSSDTSRLGVPRQVNSPLSAPMSRCPDSRSRGQDAIRLLSNCDENLFCIPSPDLAIEMDGLKTQAKSTANSQQLVIHQKLFCIHPHWRNR